jgi:hypothetical protein
MSYDRYATRILTQPDLHGCSMLPSLAGQNGNADHRVAWHSMFEAKSSVLDEFSACMADGMPFPLVTARRVR